MRAGSGRVVITPPLPVQLAGHKGPRIATGIAHDLHARALVLADGDRRIALVSVELLWLSRAQVERVRAIAAETTGLLPQQIVVACTHTHSGPDTLNWYPFAPDVDPQWIEVLCRAIASAVYIASRNLQEARCFYAVKEAHIGVNRRLSTRAGVERHPNHAGPLDPELDVLWLKDRRGAPIGSLLRHGTHPVVLGADSTLISGDWCGVTAGCIEREFGGVSLFFNGACGNVNPRVWTNSTLDETVRVGREVAFAALSALYGAGREQQGLDIRSNDLSLEAHPHPYLTRAQSERMARDRGMVAEVQAWRIGQQVFAGLPGEILVETARALETAGGGPVLPVSFANDYVGYLPTQAIVDEGGYEARTRMLSAASIAALIAAAGALAAEMHAGSRDPRQAPSPSGGILA